MFTDNAFVKWVVDFGYKTSTLGFTIGMTGNESIHTYIEPFVFQFVSYGPFHGKTTANFTVIPEINATTVTCVDAAPTSSKVGTGCSIIAKGIKVFAY